MKFKVGDKVSLKVFGSKNRKDPHVGTIINIDVKMNIIKRDNIKYYEVRWDITNLAATYSEHDLYIVNQSPDVIFKEILCC